MKLTRYKLIFSIALALITVSASADPVVFVVTSNQQFGTVNLATGAFQAISSTPEADSNLVPGPNGLLYSVGTSTGSLVTISPATGATTIVGLTGVGANVFDLGEAGGELYLTDLSNNFYTVDPATGVAHLVGPTGIPPDPTVPFSVNADGTINLCDESLYDVGGQLYATYDSFTLDPGTGTVTPVLPANLYKIDPSTGLASLISPTDMNLSASVEVNGTFYAFNANFGQVVTLDLTNGKTGFVSDVDPSAGLIFGATPIPEPTSLALFGTGAVALASRLARRRRTVSSSVSL